MSNITAYPLQDGFETTLAQSWNGATGTVYLNTAPSFTFPVGVKTYIVVNPGKTNMQVGEIDSLNVGNKTVNVSSISVGSGAGTTYTQESHSVGSTVIISDNYQFWKNIVDAVNSKMDLSGGTFTGDVSFSGTGTEFRLPNLTTAERLALTPGNGTIVYDSTLGENYQYIAGAWNAFAAGSTQPNASTTVAGKVELPTDAEVTAGTAIGGTGATLTPTNEQTNKSVSLKAAATSVAAADEFVINQGGVDKRVTASNAFIYSRGTTVTAGENLTANDLVYMDPNGSAYKTVKKGFTAAQIGSITGIDSSTTEEMIQCDYLSDDKAIILYKKSADDKIYGTVVTFARSTITAGAEVNISADVLQAANAFSFAVLTSSLFVVTYRKTSDNICYAVACTVSGTVITAGAATSMSATTFSASSLTGMQACKVSATKFFVIGPKGTVTTGSPLGICGSVSGTTITAGTTATIEAIAGGGPYRCCYIQDDVVFTAYDDGVNIKMTPLTISGTTITVKTPLASAVSSATMSSGDRLIYLGNGTIILIRNSTQFSINTYNIADQTNWTVATVGTPLYNVNNDTANSSYAQAYYLGNNMLAIANQVVGNSDVRMRLFQIINNSLVPMGDTTIAATAGEMGCCKLNTLQNKILVVWRETGTTNANFSLYWDTSKQWIGSATATTLAAATVPIVGSGPVTNSGMTTGQQYFIGDAGAIATSGTRQIGTALSTTSLLLN